MEQYEKKGVRTGLVILLVVIVAAASCLGTLAVKDLVVATSGGSYTVTQEEYDYLQRYARLFEVEKILKENHLYTADDQTYVDDAIKGLTYALGDIYTEYMTPEEYAEMNSEYSGQMAGIGMLIGTDAEDGLATVLRVYPGTPAETYGVQRYDKIVTVDGEDVTGLDVSQIASLLRGDAGTQVTVGFLRDGEPYTVTITRAEFTVDRVNYEMLDDGVGYIEITEFTGNADEEFTAALSALVDAGAKGFILDLRDNPGGYLTYVVDMADQLLPEGLIVYIEDRDGNRQDYTSDANAVDLPMVVLVNGNSASASEIMAGALQDYGAATIVGTTTYGKGLVQVTTPFASDGAALKYTFAQYFTPNGRNINGVGIDPDVYVELDTEGNRNFVDREDDAQFQKAVEILESQIGASDAQ